MASDPPPPPGTFDLLNHLIDAVAPRLPTGCDVVLIVRDREGNITFGGTPARVVLGTMALFVADRVFTRPDGGESIDIPVRRHPRG